MKKILFIQQNLQGGGAEKVLIDILNNFDYDKYDVSLLLIDGSGIYLNQVSHHVKIYKLLDKKEIITLGYLTKAHLLPIVNIYQKLRIRRILRRKEFDTIISFMEGVSAKCHGFISDKAKQNISWVHIDMLANNWCLNQFGSLNSQRKTYEHMNCVITVSDGAETSLKKLFPRLQTKVIYNLIDKKQILWKSKVAPYRKNKFTVCNVGRLANQKRQDRIIEVADLCKKNNLDIDFLILGEGPKRSELENNISKRGLSNNVHLLGFKSNPYPYIAASDIFLLTSDSEGYPLVVCESLCLGKPIVATDITGPHELLSGKAGILTTKDPVDIYNAIFSLYTNPHLLNQYARASKEKSSMFDIESQMQQIYELI